MALFEIPPEIMIALLQQVPRDVAPACPYGFLLRDASPEPLTKHWDWLKDKKLLVPESMGTEPLASLRTEHLPPGWSWNPLFAPALALLAQPRARLRVIHAGKHGTTGISHVVNDRAVMVAQLSATSCEFSDLLPLSELMERFVQEIGVSGESAPTPLRTDHKVLRVLGALAAAGVRVSGQKQVEPSSPLPIVPQIIDVLTPMLEDRTLAATLLDDLVADQLAIIEHGYVWFHPQFAPWHRALLSGEQLEIHRLNLPEGRLPATDEEQSTRLFFLGTQGHRCLVWPVQDGSHEVILARPNLQDLRAFLSTVVGVVDTTHQPVIPSTQAGTALLSHEQKTSKPRSRG